MIQIPWETPAEIGTMMQISTALGSHAEILAAPARSGALDRVRYTAPMREVSTLIGAFFVRGTEVEKTKTVVGESICQQIRALRLSKIRRSRSRTDGSLSDTFAQLTIQTNAKEAGIIFRRRGEGLQVLAGRGCPRVVNPVSYLFDHMLRSNTMCFEQISLQPDQMQELTFEAPPTHPTT